MQDLTEPATLGEALTELKKRSGRSFEALARRLSVSKSALHRYAAGDAVPARWTVVQMWARECGATAAEVAELERLWQQTSVTAEPAPTRRRPRRWWLITTGAAVTLGVAGAGTYAATNRSENGAGGTCEKRTGVRHVDSRLAGHVWATDFVCDNRDGALLYARPASTQKAAVMETDRSWFVCWTTGRTGTDIWYYSRGDRAEPGTEQEWDGWGFMAQDDVDVSVHPPDGMPRCEFTAGARPPAS